MLKIVVLEFRMVRMHVYYELDTTSVESNQLLDYDECLSNMDEMHVSLGST